MHPNLAQGIAAERRADMRRNADAYRRGRVRPMLGRGRQAAHEPVAAAGARSTAADRTAAQRTAAQRTGAEHAPAGRTPAERTPAYRSAGKMLVLPDGSTEAPEPAEFCSAGR